MVTTTVAEIDQVAWDQMVDELHLEEAQRVLAQVQRLQAEMRETFGEVCGE